MMYFLKESLARGWRLARSHRSFLYTLALLVSIPIAFLWSGQQFLDVAREYHTRAENSRIGLLHDASAVYFTETKGDIEGVRRVVQTMSDLNPDVKQVALVRLEGPDFVQESLVGDPIDLALYADFIRASSVRNDESIVFETYVGGEHVRVGVRAMTLFESPVPNYFLLTFFSLTAQDALYAEKVRNTYFSLAGIIFLIILLVLRHARIINYAELYGELKQALVAKTSFITMTAHELRSPLTALRGYAEMIAGTPSASTEIKEYAGRITESSLYMIDLVSDMLDIAKIESGSAVSVRDICNVKEVMEQLVGRLETLGKEHDIALRVEPIPEDLHIVADRTRLEQIITNLISNAIKYTAEGSVTVAATVVHGKCEIRIKDTGVGMSAEDQHKLFSPFFRTEDAEASGTEGTGLGMWITKRFIEAMGGAVDVESIHGVGTHVVVVFPLEK